MGRIFSVVVVCWMLVGCGIGDDIHSSGESGPSIEKPGARPPNIGDPEPPPPKSPRTPGISDPQNPFFHDSIPQDLSDEDPSPPEDKPPHGQPDKQDRTEPDEVVLRGIIDTIANRHTSRLDAARSRISAAAASTMEAEIAKVVAELREQRDYHDAEQQLHKLALMDLLLSDTELAGLHIGDVLRSLVERGTLTAFLTEYSQDFSTWNWFNYGAAWMSPVKPTSGYTDLQNYDLNTKHFSALRDEYTDPGIWQRAGAEMERILIRRSEQLVSGGAGNWLRDLGFSDLSRSLPSQAPGGGKRQEMMARYLPLVSNEEHRRQLQLLIPQADGEQLVLSTLLFVAGAEKTSFLLGTTKEILEIEEVLFLACPRIEGDEHVDRASYQEYRRRFEHLDEAAARWHERQFSAL